MSSSNLTKKTQQGLPALARVVGAIYRLLRPGERWRLWLTVVAVTGTALVNAGTPVLLAILLERIGGLGDAAAAPGLLLALGLAFVATKAVSRVLGELDHVLCSPLGETLVARVSLRLALAVAARRVSSKAREDLGELGALQDRCHKASRGVFTVLYVAVLRVLPIAVEVVAVGAVLGYALGWHAPIVIAAGGGLYWIFVSAGREREARAQRAIHANFAQVARCTTELTGNARLVAEYGAQGHMIGRIEDAASAARASVQRHANVGLLRAASAAVGIAACYAIAGAYAWFFMRGGALGAGTLFLMVTYVDRIIAPLNNISNYVTMTRAALISMEICDEFGIFRPQGPVPAPGTETPAAAPRLVIGTRPPLSVEPGQTVLVRGPSGAGKSSLLARAYDAASSGRPVEVTHLQMNELASCPPAEAVCYLTSQPTLLPGTVRENILLGHDEFADEVLDAVWQGVWPPVPGMAYRIGLDSDAGDLSAGERQRVGLARALLRRPRLLILDEATNALDLASERAVWAFIHAWLPRSVLLVGAHRIDNFAGADYEMDVRDGSVRSVAPRSAPA